MTLRVASALALTGALGLFAGSAEAAPQALGIVASLEPTKMTCDAAGCRAEVTAFCLQQARDNPPAKMTYRPVEGADLIQRKDPPGRGPDTGRAWSAAPADRARRRRPRPSRRERGAAPNGSLHGSLRESSAGWPHGFATPHPGPTGLLHAPSRRPAPRGPAPTARPSEPRPPCPSP